MWMEARERLKFLANRALDVVELQLGSSEPKSALAAAKYILVPGSWVIPICPRTAQRLQREWYYRI